MSGTHYLLREQNVGQKCWYCVFSFDLILTNPYSQQIYIVQTARNTINTRKSKSLWLTLSKCQDGSFFFAHLNIALTYKGLWLHLITEQQRLPASDQKRNAKHLHIQELFLNFIALSVPFRVPQIWTLISYLAHYAVNEHAIIKSVLLSSDVLQDYNFLATF